MEIHLKFISKGNNLLWAVLGGKQFPLPAQTSCHIICSVHPDFMDCICLKLDILICLLQQILLQEAVPGSPNLTEAIERTFPFPQMIDLIWRWHQKSKLEVLCEYEVWAQWSTGHHHTPLPVVGCLSFHLSYTSATCTFYVPGTLPYTLQRYFERLQQPAEEVPLLESERVTANSTPNSSQL